MTSNSETVRFVAQYELEAGPIGCANFTFGDLARERSTVEDARDDVARFEKRIAKGRHSSITGRTRIIKRRIAIEETIVEERGA